MADTKRYTFLAMAPLVAFSLFVFMVLLVSTGDSGDVVKGRKIGDVIMPDREIETITSEEVEPPEEPEIAPVISKPLALAAMMEMYKSGMS